MPAIALANAGMVKIPFPRGTSAAANINTFHAPRFFRIEFSKSDNHAKTSKYPQIPKRQEGVSPLVRYEVAHPVPPTPRPRLNRRRLERIRDPVARVDGIRPARLRNSQQSGDNRIYSILHSLKPRPNSTITTPHSAQLSRQLLSHDFKHASIVFADRENAILERSVPDASDIAVNFDREVSRRVMRIDGDNEA